MILYHINKRKYQHVWPPEGTLHSEGRWNKPGQWIIYSSPSVALAKLEILANENNLPLKRVCMVMEIGDPASVFAVEREQLPDDWHAKPYPITLHRIAERFLQSSRLLMTVPSAQSHREHNFLINVRHPQFHHLVKLNEIFSEPLDGRLK